MILYLEGLTLIIQHNLLANFTDRQLGINTTNKSKSTEKLSTGYRINRAADDAAGLSISEKMRAQIRGLDQASNNIQDGISLLQTGDGALGEIHDILQRMGELSVQAANDIYTDEDRDKIDGEFFALKREINRITSTTEFNTYPIFLDDDLPVGGYPNDIKIYSSSPGSYGGIVYNNVRYDWSKIKTKDGEHSLADTNISEGIYYLETVDGQMLSFSMGKDAKIPDISKQYNINASKDFIQIDGTIHNWASVRDDNGRPINLLEPRSGVYSFSHYGSIIEFYVDEGDTLEDILRTLNNSKEISPSWESQLTSIPRELAVRTSQGSRSYVINDENKYKIKDAPYMIHANAQGIRLDGYNTVPWSKLEFTPPFYDGSTKGIDFTTGAGIGNGTSITFECPDTGITFRFSISEESSFDGVIQGLDGVIIDGFVESSLKSDMLLSDNPQVMDSSFQVVDITIPFEKQRDELNIDFENKTWTSNSGFSDFAITFEPNSSYPLSEDEMDKLDQFFRYGTENMVQLTFGEEDEDKISISFDRANNQADTNRPQAENYDLISDYEEALDSYVKGMIDGFKEQLSSSTFSVSSDSASLHTGTVSENSILVGNAANAPRFGIKPEEGFRIKNIQAGANSNQTISLELNKLSTAKLGIMSIDLKSHISASEAITIIHNGIERISAERTKLGAYNNRLEHAMANADNMSENMQGAESSIRDVNMSDEMVKLSKHKILEQASQAMLSQANMNAGGVLKLLE